jgi:hypothetical protein
LADLFDFVEWNKYDSFIFEVCSLFFGKGIEADEFSEFDKIFAFNE